MWRNQQEVVLGKEKLGWFVCLRAFPACLWLMCPGIYTLCLLALWWFRFTLSIQCLHLRGLSDGTWLSPLSPIWELSAWNSHIPLGQCRSVTDLIMLVFTWGFICIPTCNPPHSDKSWLKCVCIGVIERGALIFTGRRQHLCCSFTFRSCKLVGYLTSFASRFPCYTHFQIRISLS